MWNSHRDQLARAIPRWLYVCAALLMVLPCAAATRTAARKDAQLVQGWRTVEDDSSGTKYDGFETAGFDDRQWLPVRVPHNWQGYYNSRQVSKSSRHGFAWYRTKFRVERKPQGERLFLMFEGAGPYAQIWVNGKPVGQHAGGLTSFTLDITEAVRVGSNLLAVRVSNPGPILDLPWVPGDDNDMVGFSEGSQPFGVFRPVHLIRTAEVRVEPFGVHVWNGADITAQAAQLHVRTEVRNYGSRTRVITVLNRLSDKTGKVVSESRLQVALGAGATVNPQQDLPTIANPHLWSPDDPYLYRLHTTLIENGRTIDQIETPYGIRWISWEANEKGSGPFLVNGKPVFLNGIAEYEHLLGGSHAFSEEQIRARVRQIEAAGFNAFRDGHHPHNLRYQQYWDQDGLLWWPQFSAHVWFDNPEFRANFKRLLADWVKERRNSPSVILWGLQNESVLPPDFVAECMKIIRRLDPTASSQRKIVTCNFGNGSDWNVLQIWSGTYLNGKVEEYDRDLEKARLVGEYGAWRSIDFHTETLTWKDDKRLSEERMNAIMEAKVVLAESVRDKVAGHFFWIFSSHENPGREMKEDGTQIADGIRPLDRVGPANNKGLLTSWGEPLDVYYMYRAHYAPKATQPMVYIVSHTWPDRWTTPGVKNGIVVYSNCDEVELFNDIDHESLGTRKRDASGGHFQWDGVPVKYNVLYAVGKVNGRVVAKDMILLHYLPAAPHLSSLTQNAPNLTKPARGQKYLYRVHCGGPEYKDVNGNVWVADRHFRKGGGWGFTSWADEFPNLDPELGSKRQTYDLIEGTSDPELFRSLRYGREKLQYIFTVPDGEYNIELYFTEPWYGRGSLNAKGWRLFDVAVNGRIVLHDLDIWSEAGFAHALKKTVRARAVGGKLVITFPRVASYQAIISAIAISSANPKVASANSAFPVSAEIPNPVSPKPGETRVGHPRTWGAIAAQKNELIADLQVLDQANAKQYSVQSYLDNGNRQYGDDVALFAGVPASLLGSTWIRTASNSRGFQGPALLRFTPGVDAEVYVAHDKSAKRPAWLSGWEETKQECLGIAQNPHPVSPTAGETRVGHPSGMSSQSFRLYRRRFTAGQPVELGANGDGAMYSVFVTRSLPSPLTPQTKRKKTLYPATQAVSNGRIESEAQVSSAFGSANLGHKNEKAFVRLPETGEGSIRWKINVGLNGKYKLTFRYSLAGTTACEANVKMLDRLGNAVVALPLRFSATANGEWGETKVKTGASINAGDFDVVLSLPSACGMAVDSLGVE